jgi:hypothetical protein
VGGPPAGTGDADGEADADAEADGGSTGEACGVGERADDTAGLDGIREGSRLADDDGPETGASHANTIKPTANATPGR